MGIFSRLWEEPGPDKGWSWVVAVSTCWITFCTYGVSRAAGVLFVALVESFGVGRKEASWPFTLAPATGCFFSVIAGVMFRFMSTRQTVFIGGTLCALGIGLCFFAYDIQWFVICWGIIYGLGLALSVPLLVSILNEYFLKHRATANGIYLSGSTLGCFCIPPLLGYLVDKYGLKGTMLIQAGFTLHIFIGALLLRPRTKFQFPVLQDNPIVVKKINLGSQELSKTPGLLDEEDEDHDTTVFSMNDDTGSFEVSFTDRLKSSIKSIKQTNGFHALEDTPSESLHQKDSVRSRVVSNMGSVVELRRSQLNINTLAGSITMLDSIGNVPQNETAPTRGYFRLLLEIICDPFFYTIVLSSASCFIPLFTFMVVIMDFGIDRGMTKDKAVLLMSAISVPELLGRLCFGWISDKGYVKYKTLFMIAKVIAAVLLFCLPEVTNEAGIFVVAGIYGAVESCSIILLNVLFVEYLGLEKLSIAFSWSIFMNGFIFLAMPYIIGLFRDSLGKYDYLFYLLAVLCLASALSWLLEPVYLRRKKKKATKK